MRRAAVGALTVALLVAGCGPKPAPPAPPPPPSTSTATPDPVRDFTVATTEQAATFDPALASTPADDLVAYNVFQRLMTTAPGDTTLKPDAARDCLFESPVLYRCTLRDNMFFSNGDPVTAADVKFSVLRAFRLGAQTDAQAMASLDHIDTPTPTRVEFHLKWTDNQFGYALASANASIVDSKYYDPDNPRPNNLAAIGSGPYQLTNTATTGLLFTAFRRYVGFTPPGMERIVLGYFKDTAAIEDAITQGTVDMTWRGLSAASTQRLSDAAKNSQNPKAFHPITQPASIMTLLVWNPASPARADATLRTVVATALQGDRTLDSLLPPTADGHTAAFPLGGSASIPALQGDRRRLTMSYTGGDAVQLAAAQRIRDNLEQVGLSVQIAPDNASADLTVTDSTSWVSAPVSYLRPYLANPLPGSASKLNDLDQRYRGVSDKPSQQAALAEIQMQAAADLIVLPVEQHDAVYFAAPGVSLLDPKFGPGWQFALWSIRK